VGAKLRSRKELGVSDGVGNNPRCNEVGQPPTTLTVLLEKRGDLTM
jgi:hypothetical protein